MITGLFASSIKKRELQRQDDQLALRLTEMKHQQLVAAQEWAKQAEGVGRPVELWDPLVTTIAYLKGLKEFRDTGTWKKGDEAHKTVLEESETIETMIRM